MTNLEKLALEETEKRTKYIVADSVVDQLVADKALKIVRRGIADIYIEGFTKAVSLMEKNIKTDLGYHEYYEKELLLMLNKLLKD